MPTLPMSGTTGREAFKQTPLSTLVDDSSDRMSTAGDGSC